MIFSLLVMLVALADVPAEPAVGEPAAPEEAVVGEPTAPAGGEPSDEPSSEPRTETALPPEASHAERLGIGSAGSAPDNLQAEGSPGVPPPEGTAFDGLASVVLVLLGLVLVGAGLVRWGRGRGWSGSFMGTREELLNVVARAPTPGGGLLLVDVATPDQGKRRLLVGTGSGPPTLVADLGDDMPIVLDERQSGEVANPEHVSPVVPAPSGQGQGPPERAHEEPEVQVQPRSSEAVDRPFVPGGSGLHRYAQVAEQAGMSEVEPEDPLARQEQAQRLVEEVLAERARGAAGGERES